MEKSKGVAYLLYFVGLFGWLGFHRFYLGKIGTGILWIVTGGLFGLGALYDLFTLSSKVELHNARIREEEFKREMRESIVLTNNTISNLAASSASKGEKGGE